jgi:hypothetical protein
MLSFGRGTTFSAKKAYMMKICFDERTCLAIHPQTFEIVEAILERIVQIVSDIPLLRHHQPMTKSMSTRTAEDRTQPPTQNQPQNFLAPSTRR